MTAGTVRSQGAELFFIDTISFAEPAVVKMPCPIAITGMGGARDRIDTSTLDNRSERTYVAGLGNPTPVLVPFTFRPGSATHRRLFSLRQDGRVLDWLVCLSDGTGAPTLDSGAFVVPTDRSSLYFRGYLAGIGFKLDGSDLVRGLLIIQRSGGIVFSAAVPEPSLYGLDFAFAAEPFLQIGTASGLDTAWRAAPFETFPIP